jgi:predicted DNA-binding transcriptional regulator AlpA
MEMSVASYAKSIGKSRGTVYRWITDKEAGGKSKLPKNVKVKKVVDHFVLVVK